MTTSGALDKAIGLYVAIRDQKREMKTRHAAEMKPLQDKLDKIEGLLDTYFQQTGAKNIGTEQGTAYLYVKPSASLADPQAFMNFVREQEHFDLMDKRANVTACVAFAKKFGGLPPGVNLTMNRKVGFRRPGEKGDDNE